jgi:hypothetical protein
VAGVAGAVGPQGPIVQTAAPYKGKAPVKHKKHHHVVHHKAAVTG